MKLNGSRTPRLVLVVLDLVAPRDIDEARVKGMRSLTRRAKIARLFRQAHEQGAVLSLADVSPMIHINFSTLSWLVRDHEHLRDRRDGQRAAGRSTTWAARSRTSGSSATSGWWSRSPPARSRRRLSTAPTRSSTTCNASAASGSVVTAACHRRRRPRRPGTRSRLVQSTWDLIEEFGLPRLPNSQGKEDSRT